jgi:hypothetical protein
MNEEPLEPNPAPELEDALRTAFRALASTFGKDVLLHAPEQALPDLSSLTSELKYVFDAALRAFDAERGPLCLWRGRHELDDWSPRTLIADANRDEHTNANEAGELLWDDDDFLGSSLGRAASAYRRECRWDFGPGEAGVWLIAACPYSASGGADTENWTVCGNLAAFAVLHDRDADGSYESLAHVWTARGWRRRGLAAGLVREARERFGVSKVESPLTDDGFALIRACGLGQEAPTT